MRVLTPEGEELEVYFREIFGDSGCTCHYGIPPCGSCTHEGNPRNLEEDESMWMEVPDDEATILAKKNALIWGSW